MDGTVNSGQGWFVDDVAWKCDTPSDPNPYNNTATASITVVSQSRLSITKTQNIDMPVLGRGGDVQPRRHEPGPVERRGRGGAGHAAAELEVRVGRVDAGHLHVLQDDGRGALQRRRAGRADQPCVTPPLPNTVNITIRAQAVSSPTQATSECPGRRAERGDDLVHELPARHGHAVGHHGHLYRAQRGSEPAAGQRGAPADPELPGQGRRVPDLDRGPERGRPRVQGGPGGLGRAGLLPAAVRRAAEGRVLGPAAAGQRPGTSWAPRCPTGAKSGMLFNFTTKQLSQIGAGPACRPDDIIADLHVRDAVLRRGGRLRRLPALQEGVQRGPGRSRACRMDLARSG